MQTLGHFFEPLHLRLYTNYPQNDWVEWLALAKFAHNQNSTTTSGYSPFILNYGRQSSIRGEHQKHVRNQLAKEFVEMMQGTFKLAKESLEHTASDMKKFYDWNTRPTIKYQKGDLVLLEETNIWSDRPSKKLGNKRYGPFKIIEKVGNSAYQLKLDPKWCGIHNVFNEYLLHPYHQGMCPSQKTTPPPPSDLINRIEE